MQSYFEDFTDGLNGACENPYENLEWDELGPNGLEENVYVSNGVGRINRIVFDPNYDGITNKTIFASAEHSGLWKSTDDGLNWNVLNTDYQLPITSVSDVAIDHNNSDNIFISTGTADLLLNSEFSPNNALTNPIWTAGIYRSKDGGSNWSPINNGLLSFFTDGGAIRNIKTHPTSGNKLYAATSKGFFYTTNALVSSPNWTNVTSGLNDDSELRGLEFKPNNPNVLYLSGKDIYRSTNSGLVWQSLTNPSVYPGLDIDNLPDNFAVDRINIAVTPDNSEAVFAYIVGKYDYSSGGVIHRFPRAYIYKFTGSTWQQLYIYTPTVNSSQTSVSAFEIVDLRMLGIAVSPIDEDLVVFGNTVVKGTDPTTGNFTDISGYFGPGIHADIRDVTFSPTATSPKLFVGTDGGVSEGVINYSNPHSVNWHLRCNGLITSTLWTFDMSEKGEAYVIGHQDNGTGYLEQGDDYWSILGGGDGYFTAISNYFLPRVYYNGLSSKGMFPLSGSVSSITPKSLEYPITDAFIPITYTTFHNHLAAKDYFVFSEIYQKLKLKEAGDAWDDIWKISSDVGYLPIFSSSPNGPNDLWRHQLSEVAASQVDPNIVYVAVGGFDEGVGHDPYVKPALLKTETGLVEGTPDPNNPKFFDLTPNLPKISPTDDVSPCITGLAVDPENPDKVWVTFTGYYSDKKVWKSTDGGQTWQNDDPEGSLANLPVNNIVIQDGTRVGNSDNRIFIATDAGVYYKEPEETCWAKYGLIPNVRVTEIKTNTCENTIVAATYGRGLWKADMPAITSPLATINISENTTWDTPRFFEENLRIEPGITLTVKDMVYMPSTGNIFVEPGATLIVDGGTITSACGKYWYGIQVWGDYDENQYSAGGGQYYQGRAIFKNHAVVENAGCALINMKPDDWSKVGGIIQASNTTFRNNRRSVAFLAYQNFYYVNGVKENRPDRSFFRYCDFINDNDQFIPNSTYPPLPMITMYKVNGISYTACNFTNTMTAQNSEQRGKAIFSIDANYRILGQCNGVPPVGQPCTDYIPSTFTGFNIAVHASEATANSGPLIRNSKFDEDMVGIFFDHADYGSAIFNDFIIGDHEFDSPSPSIDEANYNTGIKTFQTSFFTVEENDFEKALNPYANFTHGVLVSESGNASNELYFNTLKNLTSGSIAQGENASNDNVYGLRFICNKNINNKHDFEVRKTSSGQYSFISSFQSGDFQYHKSAGNTFSPPDGNNTNYVHFDIFSNAHYNYLFDNNEPTQIPSQAEAVVSNGNIDLDNDGSPNTCPSHFDTGGIIDTPVKMVSFLGGKSEYYNLLYSYHQLIDDGNTEGLLNDVALTWPEDAWDLHDQLMAKSPYLSEAVLISAADRNILPQGMLLEILMANPDALKSGSVIKHVECCIPSPLPAYMIDILKSAQDVNTARTLIEKNLSSLHLNMTRDYKYVAAYFLNDTLGVSSDSTLSWIKEMKTIEGRYATCTEYLNREDYQLAKNELDSISYNNKLTDDEEDELSDMRDFVDFIQDVNDDGRNIAQLDSTEIDFLIRMANIPEGGTASIRAENILCFFYGLCKEPDAAPKSNNTNPKKPKVPLQELLNAQNILITSPNPADQYIQLELSLLFSKENSYLTIWDTQGRKIDSRKIGGVNNSVFVFDTRKMAQGVYIVEVTQDGQQVLNDKFIVQH